MRQIINTTIDNSENILEKPDRRIGVASLEGDSYKLSVSVWVHAHGFQDIRFVLEEAILQEIKDAGIRI